VFNKALFSILVLYTMSVIAIGCGTGGAGGSAGPDDGPPGGIRGTWSSEDDVNIQSIKVILTDGDYYVSEKSFDYLSGDYFFENVSVGEYAVVIDMPNLYWEIVENIPVTSGLVTPVDNIIPKQ